MNKIYATLALSALLTACGSSDDNYYSNSIAEIQGDWITGCITRRMSFIGANKQIQSVWHRR